MKQSAFTRRDLLMGLGIGASSIPVTLAQTVGEQIFHFRFDQETHGWTPGLSDYTLGATELRFTAEIRKLPLHDDGQQFRAYYIQSHNTPDDLFMFLKKELAASDGVEPYRTYTVSIHIGFLSNAPSGLAGIGGSPGTNVYLKAGVSLLEPVTILEPERGYLRLNLDKGSQDESGCDLQTVSNIENGQQPHDEPKYVYIERIHHFPMPVRTDQRGSLWITVGTESGFEGLTGVFISEIVVVLRPQ